MPASPREPSRERLERDFADQLAAVTNVSHQLEHRFGATAQLHQKDFRALTAIYVAENAGQPLTPSDLARDLSLSSGAVTYLVERLVASGHVRRDAHPYDRRKVILRYDDHGREVAAGFFGPLAGHTHSQLAAHSDEEIAAAIAVL
ncbi:MAG: MarR family transcriptional regulator, partial [Micrococcales bacterium]|nr:MarR family transcriptional regulator [Micrococcales bacterium]